ncbi:cupin domain-containing protein [Streptomyces sp. NPDC127051]|uniref:cupin domain-containing protein n=1 Tax=Streptomyces sp. NPDC127051 TaxID=3347119 RepID=UPI003665998E
MTQVSVVGPDGGETIRLGRTQMRILEDGTTTGHRLGIGEITLAPHTEGPPQHRHAQHDEGFYVVSGTVHFTIGETVHIAPPGTLAMIPPGAPHTFANLGDEPAVMINTFTPDLYVAVLALAALTSGNRPAGTARHAADGTGTLLIRQT